MEEEAESMKICIDGPEVKGKNDLTVWKTKPMIPTATKTLKKNKLNLRVKTLGSAAVDKKPVECF